MFSVPLLSVDNMRLDRDECFDDYILDLILGAFKVKAHFLKLILELQQVPLGAVRTIPVIAFIHRVIFGLIVVFNVSFHIPLVDTIIGEVNETFFQAIHVGRVFFCRESRQTFLKKVDF